MSKLITVDLRQQKVGMQALVGIQIQHLNKKTRDNHSALNSLVSQWSLVLRPLLDLNSIVDFVSDENCMNYELRSVLIALPERNGLCSESRVLGPGAGSQGA
jgi:hypothetical protein